MTRKVNEQGNRQRAAGAPEVSIGLPVYNGERYLEEAVEALCKQSFGDFELIISDNASTDHTAEVCVELANKDPRIRLVRQPRNIGAIRNWDFVAQAARGTYFKWASANDRIDETMLEKCVDVLRRDDTVALCYGRTCLVDASGTELELYGYDLSVEQVRPSERFMCVRNRMNLNNAMSGLIRMESLKQTRLGRLYPDGDLIMMAELALLGKFRLLSDVLLYRRMDIGAASRFLAERELRVFLDPDSAHKGLTIWRRHLDCCWSVLRARITLREKVVALDFAARSAYWDRGALWRDLFRRPG